MRLQCGRNEGGTEWRKEGMKEGRKEGNCSGFSAWLKEEIRIEKERREENNKRLEIKEEMRGSELR